MSPGSEEYAAEQRRDLMMNCMDFLVTVSLFATVMSQWPDDVQENFVERIGEANMWLHSQIEELQQFAEAYDEQEGD